MHTEIKTADISSILERHPGREGQSALMALLQEIQETVGYLPEESLEEVGRHLNIPLSHIFGVVSFYAQFSLEPRGKHIIRLCMGTACHIRGGHGVQEEIESYLDIKDKKTTDDHLFTLEVVRCLGTCFLAPVMMIDEKYYGKLTRAKVRKILAEYQKVKAGV